MTPHTRLYNAAFRYFHRYLQDEFDNELVCLDEQQHAAVVELYDALCAVEDSEVMETSR